MINKNERTIQLRLDARQTFISDYVNLDRSDAMGARRVRHALKNKQKGGEKI